MSDTCRASSCSTLAHFVHVHVMIEEQQHMNRSLLPRSNGLRNYTTEL